MFGDDELNLRVVVYGIFEVRSGAEMRAKLSAAGSSCWGSVEGAVLPRILLNFLSRTFTHLLLNYLKPNIREANHSIFKTDTPDRRRLPVPRCPTLSSPAFLPGVSLLSLLLWCRYVVA